MTCCWSPRRRRLLRAAPGAAFLLSLALTLTLAQGSPTHSTSHRPHADHLHISSKNESANKVKDQPETKIKVPKPFNLAITSFNFNTTLYWDDKITSTTHHFQVEIKDYDKGENWTVVRWCRNISHNYCDLSKKFDNPHTFYHVRVKAFVGSEESEYALKKDFCLRVDGKIGPPTLNLSFEDEEIVVDIWHPYAPLVGRKQKTVRNFYEDFEYDVYVGENATKHQVEECDDRKCTAYILTQPKSEKYCISAQGKSNFWAVIGEKSNEACLDATEEKAAKSAGNNYSIILFTTCIIFIIVILIIICGILIYRKTSTNCPQSLVFTKTHKKLPQSLESVVRNVRSRILMTTEQEAKYDHVHTSYTDTIAEKNTWVKDEDPLKDNSNNNDSRQTTDDPEYPASLKEMEEKSYDDHEVKGLDELHSNNRSNNNFHTDSDTNESSTTSEIVTPECSTELTSYTDAKCTINSFGYDKPHVPLNLLLQLNEEESGIKHSNTDDS
ncbi:interferon gamma receptor 1 isoform X2 [Ascaphus truei]|uniref:interferon gamma receptor 1 isoform X2 n=1 Tax=Ascaphus truei TaxID=8439 RepID=UPI003F5A219D